MRTSDLLVKCLENEGVEFVFGIPGEETLDLMDSLSRSNIKFILTRHEQAAAFMADAHGRLTGKAGVCLSTLGPGATNLLTGVADAYLDRVPLVAITGQAELGRIHKESHQYIDIVENFETATKWNTRIEVSDVVPEVVRKAFKVAETEKPGSVHLEIPANIAGSETSHPNEGVIPPIRARRSSPDRQSLRHAADLIERSSFPVMLAGNGVVRKNAAAQLCKFAELFNIPVVTTFMGKGAITAKSNCYVGTLGLASDRLIADVFSKADIVVAVGYDLVEYAPMMWNPNLDKKIVHIDFTTSEVDMHYVPEVEINSDIRETLELLEGMISSNKKSKYMSSLHDELIETFEQEGVVNSWPVSPQRVLYAIRQVMGVEDILVSDVGTNKLWVGKFYPVYGNNTLLMSNGFATMGFGLPVAVGAKLLCPDKKVLAVCGDGGFMMNAQEIETARRLGLNIVIVIFNDGGYNLIRWKSLNKWGKAFGVDFTNPDFVKLADSFGAEGIRIESSEGIDQALTWAFSRKGPVIIDVPIDYSVNSQLVRLL
ncbi:MAG TPA: acetolactate synthase large subunit [Dehalococcoidales bacterium]|nr:acetolactate synthase large subunit [Dehalococcoidales bacterium]